jgi:hypothetical protein
MWSVVEDDGGTITSSGHYTAPLKPGTYHVRATSRSNTLLRGVAEVLVPAPVEVSLSPSSLRVKSGQVCQLWPRVTGEGINVFNDKVVWQVVEAGGGSVDSNGRYTAPATAGTYHVRATSVTDPSKSATMTVSVTANAAAVVTPLRALPSNPDSPKLSDGGGEPRIVKDRSPGALGELLGAVTTDRFRLVKSADKGATWTYVPSVSGALPGNGVFMFGQDSAGKLHLVERKDDLMFYSRIALDHTGGAITGFRTEVSALRLPGVINAFIQIRGVMQTVKDGAGSERLMFSVCSYEDEATARFCLRMGTATSLSPSTTADFRGLDLGASLTTVFQTAVYGIGGHGANFAQLGASRDVWVFFGLNHEYGVHSDGSSNQRVKLSPNADHSWTVGKPINIDQPSAITRPTLMSVVGTQNHVWVMRSDPVKGVSIDQIGQNGSYTYDVVPSPESYPERAGLGAMSVSADERRIAAIWFTMSRYDAGVTIASNLLTAAVWDGSAWSPSQVPMDALPGTVCNGLFSTNGWSDGQSVLLLTDQNQLCSSSVRFAP